MKLTATVLALAVTGLTTPAAQAQTFHQVAVRTPHIQRTEVKHTPKEAVDFHRRVAAFHDRVQHQINTAVGQHKYITHCQVTTGRTVCNRVLQAPN